MSVSVFQAAESAEPRACSWPTPTRWTRGPRWPSQQQRLGKSDPSPGTRPESRHQHRPQPETSLTRTAKMFLRFGRTQSGNGSLSVWPLIRSFPVVRHRLPAFLRSFEFGKPFRSLHPEQLRGKKAEANQVQQTNVWWTWFKESSFNSISRLKSNQIEFRSILFF